LPAKAVVFLVPDGVVTGLPIAIARLLVPPIAVADAALPIAMALFEPLVVVAIAVAPGPSARAMDPGVLVQPEPIDMPPTDAHEALLIAGETSVPATHAPDTSAPITAVVS
jgi:hypothetical protein